MNNTYSTVEVAFDPLLEQAKLDLDKLAPDSWTDHTTSDPGITILEQIIVQFALLAQKLDLPVADLLASEGPIGESANPVGLAFPKPVELKEQFFTADEALTCAAVTTNDRRRLLLDHPLVANVLVEPVRLLEKPLYWSESDKALAFDELSGDYQVGLPGRYRALVELIPNHGLDAEQKQALSDELFDSVKDHRNLCESWQEVIIMEPEYVKIRGGITLKPGADVEQTLIELHRAISDYINPPLMSHSKVTLQAQGLGGGAIHQGPVLTNGYYSEDELDTIEVRSDVRVSDIIRLVLDFPQVSHVHRLQLSNFDSPADDDWRDWVLPISSGRVARLIPLLWVDPLDPGAGPKVTDDFIRCFKDDAPCPASPDEIETRLAQRAAALAAKAVDKKWYDIKVPEGTPQDISYASLQTQFPVVYGLAENQLLDSVGKERLAKVKQLQGYLLIFDQVIANYHQQLADMGLLLDSKQRPEKSYNAGEFEAEALDELTVVDYWAQIKDLVQSELTENPEERHNFRENRLLSHLFARLGERFSDQSSLGFTTVAESFEQYLAAKKQGLLQMAKLAHDRFVGKDYLADIESGLVQRMASKLGLYEIEGVGPASPESPPLVIEHSLLYPKTSAHLPAPYHSASLIAQLRTDGAYYPTLQAAAHGLREGEVISLFDVSNDKDHLYSGSYAVTVIDENTVELPLDLGLDEDTDEVNTVFTLRWIRGTEVVNPYAMKVSMVFRQEVGRYEDPEFRRTVEVMARAETPAHVSLNIRWLDEANWTAFETLYGQWLALHLVSLAAPTDEPDATRIPRQEQQDDSANQLLTFLL